MGELNLHPIFEDQKKRPAESDAIENAFAYCVAFKEIKYQDDEEKYRQLKPKSFNNSCKS